MAAGAYTAHSVWSDRLHESQVRAAQSLIRDLQGLIQDEGDVAYKERIERYVRENPDLAYVYFADFRGNRKFAWQDIEKLNRLSPDFASKVQQTAYARGEISKILPKSDLEYLHEVGAVYVPEEASSDQTPAGIMKAGYVLPGKIGQSIRFGQGYRHILLLWYALSTTIALFLAFNDLRGAPTRRPAYAPGAMTLVPDPQKTEEAELTWLEDETGKTEPIFVDEQGRSWRILLDRDSLAGWSVRGNWYVNDAQLCGRPWGGSVVRQDAKIADRYHFSLRASKMAGSDGFVVLFPCGRMELIWVLGGWGNTRTEILGYPSTSNSLKIRKGEWYFVEVRMEGTFVAGYVNGEQNFKIARDEIQYPSPNVNFQKGIGVGVWSTLVKFSDIRLLEYGA